MNIAQQTVNTSKRLNPFDHVRQNSLNSISSESACGKKFFYKLINRIISNTNTFLLLNSNYNPDTSSPKIASQPPKPISSPDPYEAFRTLNLSESEMSLSTIFLHKSSLFGIGN